MNKRRRMSRGCRQMGRVQMTTMIARSGHQLANVRRILGICSIGARCPAILARRRGSRRKTSYESYELHLPSYIFSNLQYTSSCGTFGSIFVLFCWRLCVFVCFCTSPTHSCGLLLFLQNGSHHTAQDTYSLHSCGLYRRVSGAIAIATAVASGRVSQFTLLREWVVESVSLETDESCERTPAVHGLCLGRVTVPLGRVRVKVFIHVPAAACKAAHRGV